MDLNDYRKQIDEVDEKLLDLFLERQRISLEIAAYKQAHGLATENTAREAVVIEKRRAQAGEEMAPYAEELFRCLITQSKALQNSKRPEAEK